MAVTANGTPYVESSDLVANYPGVSLALAEHIDDLQKILQVVQASTSTETVIASAAYTDTTLAGTITPSTATSKILILLAQPSAAYRGAANIFTSLQLLRDATVIVALGDSIGQQSTGVSSVQFSAISPMTYLDSPNTTSAITYKTQGKVNSTSNGGQATFQQSGIPSYMILIEVAA